MKNKRESWRVQLMRGCVHRKDLRDWLWNFLGLRMPKEPVCPGHCSPMDYLWGAYSEPARDMIVWASRGGGKTRLGAVATLLDLLHKPGVQVRILGGSLEQSRKMWDYLLPDLEALAGPEMVRTNVGREVRVRLDGERASDERVCRGADGIESRAAVLAQSQRAVRGLRVQKLRCDEVELFDAEVWDAAQLATRTEALDVRDVAAVGGFEKRRVAGVVEALSTYHKPWGLMKKAIDRAQERGTTVLHWCLLDVLEKCPPERDCTRCPLWAECGGIAKTKCDGFYGIDDAIIAKRRVSPEMWETEMLCRRPVLSGRVFRSFERNLHVREEGDVRLTPRGPVRERSLAMDFGFRTFACLCIVTLEDGTTHVVDEHVASEQALDVNLRQIEAKAWGRPRRVACDPAGAGRNDQTAESDIALLRRDGYTVRSRPSSILDGIEQVRFALMSAAGEVRLFVSKKCVRLIEALECYHYGDDGSEIPRKDGVHDHLIDALRYHFVNRTRGEVKGGKMY